MKSYILYKKLRTYVMQLLLIDDNLFIFLWVWSPIKEDKIMLQALIFSVEYVITYLNKYINFTKPTLQTIPLCSPSVSLLHAKCTIFYRKHVVVYINIVYKFRNVWTSATLLKCTPKFFPPLTCYPNYFECLFKWSTNTTHFIFSSEHA